MRVTFTSPKNAAFFGGCYRELIDKVRTWASSRVTSLAYSFSLKLHEKLEFAVVRNPYIDLAV